MKKLILISGAAILLQTQVYCQLKNYNDGGKVKILAEKTTLSATGISVKLTPDEQSAALIAAAGKILPPLVKGGVNGVKQKMKKNALAYKGEFKCSFSGEKFYTNNDFAALPQLTIKRTIKIKDGTDQLAIEIVLVPELSADKTAFRYYVKDKCSYNYSIAKTKGNYDYIDLNLEIKFKSIAISKEEYKISELRATALSIPMIYVGKTKELSEKVYSGWIPLPPRSTAKTIKKTDTKKSAKTTVKSGSDGKNDTTTEEVTETKYDVEDYAKLANDNGLYEVEIIATETNPYKIKAENKQEFIENSSESIIDVSKAIIESLTKEKKDNGDKKE